MSYLYLVLLGLHRVVISKKLKAYESKLYTLWSVDDGTAGNPQWPVYSKMIKLAVFPVTQKVILEPEIPLIPGNSPLPPAPSLKNLTLCIYDIIFAPFINL